MFPCVLVIKLRGGVLARVIYEIDMQSKGFLEPQAQNLLECIVRGYRVTSPRRSNHIPLKNECSSVSPYSNLSLRLALWPSYVTSPGPSHPWFYQ